MAVATSGRCSAHAVTCAGTADLDRSTAGLGTVENRYALTRLAESIEMEPKRLLRKLRGWDSNPQP
jgi:hypothetical protein